MGLLSCIDRVVICQEVNGDQFYWETMDGSFGIFMNENQQPKGTKIKDVGLLRFVDNRWCIVNCKGENT